jgi:hypothetical protein
LPVRCALDVGRAATVPDESSHGISGAAGDSVTYLADVASHSVTSAWRLTFNIDATNLVAKRYNVPS